MVGREWDDCSDGNTIAQGYLTRVYILREGWLRIVRVRERFTPRGTIDGGGRRVIEHCRHIGGSRLFKGLVCRIQG